MNSALMNFFIKKNNDTQKELASALGISLSNLNAKINGKCASFRQNEIDAIRQRYELTNEDIIAIFFANELS